MPMMWTRVLSILSLAVIVVSAALFHESAQAQVRYFDHVPTPDEILAALRGAPKPDSARSPGTAGAKMRGIEWGGGSATSTESAVTSAGQSKPAVALPVNFDFGTARVSPASMNYVAAMAAVLEQNPGMQIAVEGHTDAVGSSKANTMLSWERAFSVFRLMVEKYGIDPGRLQPAGKGSSEPLQGLDPMSGMNRRVQFRVVG
ncbi:MAG TPA: OmpA family protein [Burkholderiaceae bacterium]|nr:OmpA family protein [Burkholderiaceae bacterium]